MPERSIRVSFRQLHRLSRVRAAGRVDLSIKLVKKGELKVYKGFLRGMATHADVINADLLGFIKA